MNHPRRQFLLMAASAAALPTAARMAGAQTLPTSPLPRRPARPLADDKCPQVRSSHLMGPGFALFDLRLDHACYLPGE